MDVVADVFKHIKAEIQGVKDMFNSSVHNAFSYNINAVSGTLRKSHPKSKFCIREIKDSKTVFDENKPRLTCNDCKEIVILQLMLTGENRCVIEYVLKDDFENSDAIA